MMSEEPKISVTQDFTVVQFFRKGQKVCDDRGKRKEFLSREELFPKDKGELEDSHCRVRTFLLDIKIKRLSNF